MEGFNVSGVDTINDCATVSLGGIENTPGIAYKIFSSLSENEINVIFILQSTDSSGKANIGFTIEKCDLEQTVKILEADKLGGKIIVNDKIAILTVSGVGLYHNPGIAARIFGVLYDRKIDIHLITTSEIKILAAVDKDRVDEAQRAVMKEFSRE